MSADKDREAFSQAMIDLETLAGTAMGGAEGLDRAACSPDVKYLAEIAIGAAARGCSRDGWRAEVGHTRGRDVEAELDEAEECMHHVGLWPWGAAPGAADRA